MIFFPWREQLVEADLKKIKKEMDKIIKADLPLIRGAGRGKKQKKG